MNDTSQPFKFIDNGGRRMFPDRRKYVYTFHLPERRKQCQDKSEENPIPEDEYPFTEKRSITDRRSGFDRRLETRHHAHYERSSVK